MYFKARVLEGGYLGKHSNPGMTYACQVITGSQPKTSIAKWIFEYDEAFGDAFEKSVEEEMCMMCNYVESHINDAIFN